MVRAGVRVRIRGRVRVTLLHHAAQVHCPGEGQG